MKKIVIAMLLILPLIIVASVLVATGVISNEAYIAVESVELNVDTTKTLEIGLSEGEFSFNATVYPMGAKNKSVIWKIENVQCFGDEMENPVVIDATGHVRFYTYCTFDVVVTTVEASKTARVNVYVKCDRLDGVKIEGDLDALKVGDSRALKAVFVPLDAEVDEVTWSSSDESVVKVDKNGIITACKVGVADITLKAKEFTAERRVTVNVGATKFGREFYIGDGFAVSELEAGEVEVLSGGRIEDGVFRYDGDIAVLETFGGQVVIKKCDYGDIVIENADILSDRLWYLGKIAPHIKAVYADARRAGEKVDASYRSDNESAATVSSDGKITLLNKGVVNFTAVAGGKSAKIELEFVRPVTYIRLDTVNNDDKRGIAGETVYGSEYYENGELKNYVLPINIQYPDSADWDDFILTVSDDRIATVVDGRKVIINGSVEEIKNLTVTVTAKYSAFESMQARTSRTFKIVNGVNCVSFAEMKRAAEDGKTVVMRNNVSLAEGDGALSIRSDFYGNGFMLDATDSVKSEQTAPVLKVSASGVTVSNAIIRCDDIVKINQSNGMSGTSIQIGEDEEEFLENVKIEYTVMENGYYNLAAYRAEVLVDGCIMRNASNFGIFVPSRFNSKREYVYSDLTLNNCIMSNIVATAIGMPTEAEESKDVPLRVQSKFTSTGFLDIYNWQDVTAPKMLDRPLTGDAAIDNALKGALGSALSAELSKDEYAELRYVGDYGEGDTTYIHLAMVTAGATNYAMPVENVSFEDQRFYMLSLENLFNTHVLLKLFHLKPCYLWMYKNTADVTPDSVFSEDAETYARLREGNADKADKIE